MMCQVSNQPLTNVLTLCSTHTFYLYESNYTLPSRISYTHMTYGVFCFFPLQGPMMSSEVQRPDDSPSTSGGSSDIEQRETAPPEQEREQAQPKKKETKISSKTAAKLSTSAKR